MNDESLDLPQKSKGDIAHVLVKAELSAISYVGGPTAELFQIIIQPPLEN